MDSTPEGIQELLTAALRGEGPAEARGASALRVRCRLQPAAGPGAKVMPPTYAGRSGPEYVTEERMIEGEAVPCVSLDSVASQANRIEDALAEAVRSGEIALPIIHVDQGDFGVHSALEFSHRCFDAWVEDALLEGQRFGDTDIWHEMAGTNRQSVTPLMNRFPTGILLGCWASRVRNPQGATRLARALASEVVAVGAVAGERAAGKIDRHSVSNAIRLYESAEGGRITLREGRATREGDKPKLFGREGRRGDRGRPSEAGYGNVTPSFAEHGGVTMRYALLLTTLSLPALRECRFPERDRSQDPERDVAGRLMLAALGVRMLSLLIESGLDLRSGCLLVPEEEPQVELIGRLGRAVASWPLIDLPSQDLLDSAVRGGRDHGLEWDGEDLSLEASGDQLDLLRQSLNQVEATEGE